MDWLPAISSSAILDVIGAACGIVYKRTAESAINTTFEARLEALKAQYRQDKQRLRATLDARAAELMRVEAMQCRA